MDFWTKSIAICYCLPWKMRGEELSNGTFLCMRLLLWNNAISKRTTLLNLLLLLSYISFESSFSREMSSFWGRSKRKYLEDLGGRTMHSRRHPTTPGSFNGMYGFTIHTLLCFIFLLLFLCVGLFFSLFRIFLKWNVLYRSCVSVYSRSLSLRGNTAVFRGVFFDANTEWWSGHGRVQELLVSPRCRCQNNAWQQGQHNTDVKNRSISFFNSIPFHSFFHPKPSRIVRQKAAEVKLKWCFMHQKCKIWSSAERTERNILLFGALPIVELTINVWETTQAYSAVFLVSCCQHCVSLHIQFSHRTSVPYFYFSIAVQYRKDDMQDNWELLKYLIKADTQGGDEPEEKCVRVDNGCHNRMV